MSETYQKPVILLAFANDRDERETYLRELPLEQKAISEVLKVAQALERCELEIIPNATLGEIIDAFQSEAFRDRIAVFHYGGHASSYGILLETEDGGNEAVRSAGLAEFLGKQEALELVFLNGCSTKGQVEALKKANVPRVISTSMAIDDTVARLFAERFYSGLAQGIDVRQSFEEASDVIEAQSERSQVYREIGVTNSHNNNEGWPWTLYVQENLEPWQLEAVPPPPPPTWFPAFLKKRHILIPSVLVAFTLLLLCAFTPILWSIETKASLTASDLTLTFPEARTISRQVTVSQLDFSDVGTIILTQTDGRSSAIEPVNGQFSLRSRENGADLELNEFVMSGMRKAVLTRQDSNYNLELQGPANAACASEFATSQNTAQTLCVFVGLDTAAELFNEQAPFYSVFENIASLMIQPLGESLNLDFNLGSETVAFDVTLPVPGLTLQNVEGSLQFVNLKERDPDEFQSLEFKGVDGQSLHLAIDQQGVGVDYEGFVRQLKNGATGKSLLPSILHWLTEQSNLKTIYAFLGYLLASFGSGGLIGAFIALWRHNSQNRSRGQTA